MRLLISLILVLVLVFAASAVGWTRELGSSSQSVAATPLDAGAPGAVSVQSTFARSTRGELTGFELDLARGFQFDPLAADTCSNPQALTGSCPPTSTIGTGAGRIVVQGKYLPRTPYAVSATFYLAKPRHPGDLAGLVLDLYETESKLHATMLGRVIALRHGPYGVALRFSHADRELPVGYDLSLLALTTVLQAHRTVYDLLTNPRLVHTTGLAGGADDQVRGRLQALRSTAACSR